MGNNKRLINDIIKALSKEDREQLKYAHEYSVPTYVKLPGNRFIGVCCAGMRHLIVDECYNDWYIGSINYGVLTCGESFPPASSA